MVFVHITTIVVDIAGHFSIGSLWRCNSVSEHDAFESVNDLRIPRPMKPAQNKALMPAGSCLMGDTIARNQISVFLSIPHSQCSVNLLANGLWSVGGKARVARAANVVSTEVRGVSVVRGLRVEGDGLFPSEQWGSRTRGEAAGEVVSVRNVPRECVSKELQEVERVNQ